MIWDITLRLHLIDFPKMYLHLFLIIEIKTFGGLKQYKISFTHSHTAQGNVFFLTV